jgi:ribosome maturation factor RimP
MGIIGSVLRTRLTSGAAALGFELVDAELSGGRQHRTLRVYIDSPHGVTVDDCAAVSRQLSAILDVEDPFPGSYTLEVSSPGLDRPLVTPADFRRFQGEVVKVRLLNALDGRRNFTGRLVETTGESVVIEADHERFQLPLAEIERARLVPAI